MIIMAHLYIDENGFLMCGEPGRSTSVVEGLRICLFNIDHPNEFDYEVKFINDLRRLCNGYECRHCKIEYRCPSI